MLVCFFVLSFSKEASAKTIKIDADKVIEYNDVDLNKDAYFYGNVKLSKKNYIKTDYDNRGYSYYYILFVGKKKYECIFSIDRSYYYNIKTKKTIYSKKGAKISGNIKPGSYRMYVGKISNFVKYKKGDNSLDEFSSEGYKLIKNEISLLNSSNYADRFKVYKEYCKMTPMFDENNFDSNGVYKGAKKVSSIDFENYSKTTTVGSVTSTVTSSLKNLIINFQDGSNIKLEECVSEQDSYIWLHIKDKILGPSRFVFRYGDDIYLSKSKFTDYKNDLLYEAQNYVNYIYQKQKGIKEENIEYYNYYVIGRNSYIGGFRAFSSSSSNKYLSYYYLNKYVYVCYDKGMVSKVRTYIKGDDYTSDTVNIYSGLLNWFFISHGFYCSKSSYVYLKYKNLSNRVLKPKNKNAKKLLTNKKIKIKNSNQHADFSLKKNILTNDNTYCLNITVR